MTAEATYLINFLRSRKIFFLCLQCNGKNSFLFVNATKIYQLKAKDSEIKSYPLCLGYISKHFAVNNKKRTGLNGYKYNFSVDYNTAHICDIINIHKHLMKEHDIK